VASRAVDRHWDTTDGLTPAVVAATASTFWLEAAGGTTVEAVVVDWEAVDGVTAAVAV
jgi:hypothetical protein